ncbi:unnamed protein product [Auanema sp. JU1783]|nr:unnamed protein product [Auanema sp. JU1783]
MDKSELYNSSDKQQLLDSVYDDLIEMSKSPNISFGIIAEDEAFDNLECMTTRIWQLRRDGKLRKLFHVRNQNSETLMERATREEQKQCAYLIYRLMKNEDSRYRAQKLGMNRVVDDSEVRAQFQGDSSEEETRTKDLPPRPHQGRRLSREKLTNTIKKKMQPKDYFDLVKRSRSAHSRFHLDRTLSDDYKRNQAASMTSSEDKTSTHKSLDETSSVGERLFQLISMRTILGMAFHNNTESNRNSRTSEEEQSVDLHLIEEKVEDEGFRSTLFTPSKSSMKLPPLLSFRRRTQIKQFNPILMNAKSILNLKGVVRIVYYPNCLLFIRITSVYTIPVDNGVEGEPEIECGATSVIVNFNTRNPFEGHVFVKGLFDQSDCRNNEGGRQVAGITLPFDSCNVARTRSLNPRGIFVSVTIVISFHPQFVTKVDRAYRIQCFYMEADKTVSSNIEVSDLTTAFQTAGVPMPICRYDILNGGPTGDPIQFATIGQQVYHKWTCESETQDIFCAVVHTCTVDDGNGDRIQIIDENGCARDKFLLNNLEYPTDLMAGQEAHVYKYADRAQLFYQCQISVTIKEPTEECPRPECAEPQGFGAVKDPEFASPPALPINNSEPTLPPPPPAATIRLLRKRRSVSQQPRWTKENTLDVRVELSTSDLQSKYPTALKLESEETNGICLSPITVFFIATGAVGIIALGFFIGSYLLRPRVQEV